MISYLKLLPTTLCLSSARSSWFNFTRCIQCILRIFNVVFFNPCLTVTSDFQPSCSFTTWMSGFCCIGSSHEWSNKLLWLWLLVKAFINLTKFAIMHSSALLPKFIGWCFDPSMNLYNPLTYHLYIENFRFDCHLHK